MLLLLAYAAPAARADEALDLRRGVPEDVYLVVQGMHNPERDYQKEYYEEVWKTVQETRILERALQIVTSRLGEDQLAQANSVWDQLREATAPIDIEKLAECQELIYAQQMVMWRPEAQGGQGPSVPTSQHLLLMRVTPEVAASTAEGVKNLFALVAEHSDGDVPVREKTVGKHRLPRSTCPRSFPISPPSPVWTMCSCSAPPSSCSSRVSA